MASGVILERLIGVDKLTVHILLCVLYPSPSYRVICRCVLSCNFIQLFIKLLKKERAYEKLYEHQTASFLCLLRTYAELCVLWGICHFCSPTTVGWVFNGYMFLEILKVRLVSWL